MNEQGTIVYESYINVTLCRKGVCSTKVLDGSLIAEPWGGATLSHACAETGQQTCHAHVEEHVRHRVTWSRAPCRVARVVQPRDREKGVGHHIMEHFLEMVGQTLGHAFCFGCSQEFRNVLEWNAQCFHCLHKCLVLARQRREGLAYYSVKGQL